MKHGCEASCRVRVAALGAAWLGIVAMSPALAGTTQLESRVSSRATYSDGGSNGGDDSTFLVEVTPSIRLQRREGFVFGSLQASLRDVVYADGDSKTTSFITFRGNGGLEVVKNTFFVDASASVNRRNNSIFSTRSESDPLNTDAGRENRLFSIGPRWQFRLGGGAQGSVSHRETWSNGGSVTTSRRLSQTSAQVSDAEVFGPLGWYVTYDRTATAYEDDVRNISSQIGRLGLSYRVTPRVSLRASVGREKNDYDLSGDRRKTTTGYGFDWTPTPRTQLSGDFENRIYGEAYSFLLKHRARRSAFTLSYSRDYTSSTSFLSTSINDYYYNLIYDLFAAAIPDPTERDLATRDFMAQTGLDSLSGEVGFVSNVQTERKSLRANVAVTGVRNSVVLTLVRSEDRRLTPDLVATTLDDFAFSDIIKRRGVILTWTHKLTPKSTLSSSIGRNDTEGSGTIDRSQRVTTLRVGLTRSFGARTTGALRYTHYKRDGDTSGDENTLSASLGLTF